MNMMNRPSLCSNVLQISTKLAKFKCKIQFVDLYGKSYCQSDVLHVFCACGLGDGILFLISMCCSPKCARGFRTPFGPLCCRSSSKYNRFSYDSFICSLLSCIKEQVELLRDYTVTCLFIHFNRSCDLLDFNQIW
jgi:hypothetical protein